MNPQASSLPHDIRGVIAIPLPWWQLAVLGAGLLLVLLAAAALWRWLRQRRARRPAAPRDPWDELQARLRSVQPVEPFTKEAQEDFFFQISLILREAIERRTQVPATDRTCQELKTPLRLKLPLKPEEIEAVLSFLERADVIKFAKVPSDTAEALAAQGRVATWVRALVPLSIGRDAERLTTGEIQHAAR